MAGLPEHRSKDLSAPRLTRRGSLVYYLAAWACGGLFFATVLFFAAPKDTDVGPTPDVASFLSVCFFVLLYGWAATIPFAFALRRIARFFRWNRPWPWAVCGGVLTLFFALIFFRIVSPKLGPVNWLWFLARIFELRGADGASLTSRNTLAGVGMIIAGMMTAYFLFRIDRAFAEREMATE